MPLTEMTTPGQGGSGGDVPYNYEYYGTYTWAANANLNITGLSQKPKGIVMGTNSYLVYATDGVNDNQAYRNGTYYNNMHITFGDNSITSDAKYSSSAYSFFVLILY